jgi:hypothetical protein
MTAKKIAGAAAIAGALGAAALGLGSGLGSGVAQADPGPLPPGPPGPHIVDHWDGWHALPPGQIQQLCPWHSPPGHWIGGPHGVPCS